MSVDVILGLQWGDEGKGKIVDLLAPRYDIIARFQGGPNAGHTLVVNGTKYVLHTIPSGIIHDKTLNLIGNGVVIDPVTLKKEVEKLQKEGFDVLSRLIISDKAHLITPGHKALDAALEQAKGGDKIGSTLKGIGPTYQDKAAREGLRAGDLLKDDWQSRYQKLRDIHNMYLTHYGYQEQASNEEWEEAIAFMRKMRIIQTEVWLNEQIDKGQKVLAEGAQGTLLDIDFGTYPFVTSSNTISSAACSGLGIAPSRIGEVFGIMKAYTTRVGSGPFPTELTNSTGEALRKAGNEFGATTGRPRRCGWLDLPGLRYAVMLNGVTQLIVTKVDVLTEMKSIRIGENYRLNGKTLEYPEPAVFSQKEKAPEIAFSDFQSWPELKITDSEKLPGALSEYLSHIEKQLDVPVKMISTGPGREEMLYL